MSEANRSRERERLDDAVAALRAQLATGPAPDLQLRRAIDRLLNAVETMKGDADEGERRPLTERSSATSNLTDAEYRTLLDSIDEGFCIVRVLFDETGVAHDLLFVETNPAFERYTGLVNAQGKRARDLIPTLEQAWVEVYAQVAQTGEPTKHVNYSADLGRWYEVRAARLGSEGEHIVAILFSDVSQYKETEQALRESEERIHALIANLPGSAVFVIDRDLRYLLAEGEALHVAGFVPGSLVGKTIFEVLEPALAAYYEPYYRQALAGQPFLHEHDSHGRSFVSRGVPLRNHNGEVNGVLAVSYDITAHKEAEAALRESEACFRVLFSSIDEGYCLCEIIVDDTGRAVDYRFLEANPLFEPMTGLQNVVGCTALELVPNLEQHWIDTYARVALGGETVRFENGSEAMGRWFDVFATPVQPRGRFALLFKDITQEKRVEAARMALLEREQTARREAERLAATQRLFLGMISHELRTPLASIKGFSSSLLATDVSYDLAQWRDFVGIIDEEADKLAELIDQLMDVVQLQAGTLRVRPAVDTVEQIVDMATPQLRLLAAQHRLEVALPADLPPVLADRRRVGQVLVNLVGNAAKFSPPGSAIVIEARAAGKLAEVRVSDQGEGIDPAERETVFQVFYQAPIKEWRHAGTGLGLAICKGIVEAHGGTIRVEEVSGSGASIVFTLPTAEAANS